MQEAAPILSSGAETSNAKGAGPKAVAYGPRHLVPAVLLVVEARRCPVERQPGGVGPSSLRRHAERLDERLEIGPRDQATRADLDRGEASRVDKTPKRAFANPQLPGRRCAAEEKRGAPDRVCWLHGDGPASRLRASSPRPAFEGQAETFGDVGGELVHQISVGRFQVGPCVDLLARR